MPPKAKLPRRVDGKSSAGLVSLEDAAAERIDAVTAQELHPEKFVSITSPDGQLSLFYNTSTLVRIANDKGMFMQPPHFREPMTPELRNQVERLEGKKFTFQARDVFIPNDDEFDFFDEVAGQGIRAANAGRGPGHTGGLHVLHRHVYFDQIIDEFYLLNPAEVYVCPTCYLHYITTRYVPFLIQHGRRVVYIEGKNEPVIDPLDALSHMLHEANDMEVSHSDSPSRASNDDVRLAPFAGGEPLGPAAETRDGASPAREGATTTRSPSDETAPMLGHVAFRKAADWRRHVHTQHVAAKGTTAGDYRIRDVLCTYYSDYNQFQEQEFQKRVQQHPNAKRKPALSQSRYWAIHARYNRFRYNRIVDALNTMPPEEVERCVTETPFPGEVVTTFLDGNDTEDDESDFICDDSNGGSSSSDGRGGLLPYQPDSVSELNSDTEKSENDSDSTDGARGPSQAPGTTCKRPRGSTTTCEGTSSDTSTSTGSEWTTTTGTTNDGDLSLSSSNSSDGSSDLKSTADDSASLSQTSVKRQRGHSGNVKPGHPNFTQALSREDREFFEWQSRRPVKASQLRQPARWSLAQPTVESFFGLKNWKGHVNAESEFHNGEDEKSIDWDEIGEDLSAPPGSTNSGSATEVAGTLRCIKAAAPVAARSQRDIERVAKKERGSGRSADLKKSVRRRAERSSAGVKTTAARFSRDPPGTPAHVVDGSVARSAPAETQRPSLSRMLLSDDDEGTRTGPASTSRSAMPPLAGCRVASTESKTVPRLLLDEEEE